MIPSERYKWSFISVLAGLLATGAAWKFYDAAAAAQDALEAKSILMKVHGALAFVFLIFIGALFSSHVLPFLGTRNARKKTTGMITLFFLSSVIITGYLLYYGSMELRDPASAAHFWIGIAACAAIPFHLGRYLGRSR